MNKPDPTQWSCPVPDNRHSTVQLAHGGGGRLSAELVKTIFWPALQNPVLAEMHDGAQLTLPPGRVAFSTDSFVISPLEFPGGDIGALAVHGTVNDLAMCGARPLHLSAGFILEEGLSLETLRRIVESMGRAARDAGVTVVTGDTKVVDRGKADGVFINTAGVGVIPDGSVAVYIRFKTSSRARKKSVPYWNWLRTCDRPNSDLLRVDCNPGMPARAISSGIVTSRSTSSAEAPGY